MCVYISGPLPSRSRSTERFCCLFSLNTWLRFACTAHNLIFIDNFELFWDHSVFYRIDGLHPNSLGNSMLIANIKHTVQSATHDLIFTAAQHNPPLESSSGPYEVISHTSTSASSSPWPHVSPPHPLTNCAKHTISLIPVMMNNRPLHGCNFFFEKPTGHSSQNLITVSIVKGRSALKVLPTVNLNCDLPPYHIGSISHLNTHSLTQDLYLTRPSF